MEKMNLNAIAKAYHATKIQEARARAVALVEKEIIPLLENAARTGQYSCKVEVKEKDVFLTDVQGEILKRVQCKISGYGKSFSVSW